MFVPSEIGMVLSLARLVNECTSFSGQGGRGLHNKQIYVHGNWSLRALRVPRTQSQVWAILLTGFSGGAVAYFSPV